MSGFWSTWVVVLLLLNVGLVLFLFVWGQIVKIPTEPDGTTGHVWAHGVLREGVRKLPWWWVVYSLVGVAGAIGYLLLFRVGGWTSAGELQRATAANERRLEATLAPLRVSTGVCFFAAGQCIQRRRSRKRRWERSGTPERSCLSSSG